MENIGIIESKYKSCAALTIQCLHETGIAKQDSAFKHHIENSKELGLMPDDPQVIHKTLSDYGFVMQSTHLESASCEEIIDVLSNILTEPATLLISLRSSKNSGGYMMAARVSTPLMIERFCPDPAPEHYKSRKAIHIWIRWDDGVDRSPFPRRTVKRSSTEKRIRTFENTEHYQNYNPNPCGNRIGDCVVRAFAGAMDISWNEAIDKLSSTGETTVNDDHVFSIALEKEGFVKHKALTKGSRHLTGRDYCLELDRLCSKGDRIFAYVGRCHVAAIVQIKGHYKVIDSWDSTSRVFGEFWVRSCDNPILSEKAKRMFCTPFAVGDSLSHPSFGIGVITEVIPGVITIDFGVKGIRRLGSAWVSNNCSRIAV